MSEETGPIYGLKGLVILSEAEDHLAALDPLEKIFRFAQDATLQELLITGY